MGLEPPAGKAVIHPADACRVTVIDAKTEAVPDGISPDTSTVAVPPVAVDPLMPLLMRESATRVLGMVTNVPAAV